MSEKFIERPHQNEKEEAILYVKKLLEQAKKNNHSEDIYKLEELIRLLQTKKYGLIWEEHSELVEEEMKSKIPVFVEDESRKIIGNKENSNYNFLIEGDNLHCLHLLNKTHLGKIDVIYIDPPYNTGNKDFKYNDDFVSKEDSFSHSKWLSFMSRRLRIAKKLLKKDGIIFISIDDNEYATLKLLCDEIFGESSYKDTLMVELSSTGGNKVGTAQKGGIVKNGEYVLIYSQQDLVNTNRQPLYDFVPGFDKHFTLYMDDDGNIIKAIDAIKNNKDILEEFNYLSNNNEKISLSSFAKYFNISSKMQQFVKDNLDRFCRLREEVPKIPQEIVNNLEENKYIIWNSDKREAPYYLTKTKNGKVAQLAVMSASYHHTDDFTPVFGRSTIRGDFWKDFWRDTGNLSKEGGVKLKNGKKPIRLIKQLLKYSNRSNGIFLDFFAGSGTTGHAVEQLNKEDGGNRKYILCTNNENNIAEEVTYKRLKNIQEELPHNIKYFKTDFVDKTKFPDIELENELLKYITPLVELEFGTDISNPSVQIILNEEQLKDLINNNKLQKESTLYIHPDVFFDSKDKQVIIDLNITIQNIPDYFFGKELWS